MRAEHVHRTGLGCGVALKPTAHPRPPPSCSPAAATAAPADAGSDATADGNSGGDAASDTGTGGDSGGGGDAASGDAGDGGTVVDVTCTNPSQCDAGASSCCGTIVLAGGSPPTCDVSSISTTCAAQCTTMLPFNYSGTDTVRLCSQNSDCTEQSYDKCCTFQTGGQSVTFCANTTIAGSAGATCL